MLWEAVEEDPVIGRGSGVKKIVVLFSRQGVETPAAGILEYGPPLF